MPTKEEVKEIERVFQKPISEISENNIPTYIRNREREELIEKEIEEEHIRESAR